MLLTRREMSHDFGGAKLDPVRDRDLLVWTFSQFLYGEVTGIQVGRWIERAPDIEAAAFFARQATEEFAHVRVFLEILDLLGARPLPPHRVVRLMATDLAGRTFAEHVAIEMAQGEGLVLTAIYALADTVDHPRIAALLEATARQEERHVAFGEERTLKAVEGRPRLARHLLGLALLGITALQKLEGTLGRFARAGGAGRTAQRNPEETRRTASPDEIPASQPPRWSGSPHQRLEPLPAGSDRQPGASAGPPLRAPGAVAVDSSRPAPTDHPVLSQFEPFCRSVRASAELRLRRLGLLDRPIAEMGRTERLGLIAGSFARSAVSGPFRRVRLLTSTYLDDPLVRAGGRTSSSRP